MAGAADGLLILAVREENLTFICGNQGIPYIVEGRRQFIDDLHPAPRHHSHHERADLHVSGFVYHSPVVVGPTVQTDVGLRDFEDTSHQQVIVGLGVALCASFVGLAIGLIAGFTRWVDNVIMRIMDGMMSIPAILLAIALMTLMRGGSIFNVVFAITIAEIPRVARLTRSAVLTVRELDYVEAGVACGTSKAGIIWRHVMPNTLAPITVQATYICASAMITEAILSFIGAGLPTSVPSWGNIMAEGRALWQVKPNIVFFPALFLSVTVLAVNLVGDGLRDAIDPRLSKEV